MGLFLSFFFSHLIPKKICKIWENGLKNEIKVVLIISKDQVYHHDKKMIITKPNLAQLEEHRTVKLVVIRWSPVRTREFGFFFLFFCIVLDLEGLLFLGLIIFFNQEKEEFFRSFFEYFNIRDKKNKDYLL